MNSEELRRLISKNGGLWMPSPPNRIADPIVYLARVCEVDPPEVTIPDTDDPFREIVFELISLGALTHSSRRSAVVCPACIEPHTIVAEYADTGRYRGFCPDNGWQDISAECLDIYSASLQWLGVTIADRLGRRLNPQQMQTPLPTLVSLGTNRFKQYQTALFIGRRLAEPENFARIAAAVRHLAAGLPAIVICSTPTMHVAGALPGATALVELGGILRVEAGTPRLDEGPILSALTGANLPSRGSGIGATFSPGYRSVRVGEQAFRFTDKQAVVIEALFQAQKTGAGQLHQTELQGAANTGQRVGQLFKGHPAYGTLIRYDGQGYYWLDL